MFSNHHTSIFKLVLISALIAISALNSVALGQDDDCEVEVAFTWTLDSDWCESWCKVRNANNQVVAGYFSACQNQGCAVCNITHLYAWAGTINADLTNGVYVITQTITLPGGDYTIEMHDGYGDGWSDNPSEGLNALTIEGNIIYHIDFTNGFLTTGEITLSCDPNIEGCMDITACNYNSNAIADDGSCLYFDACGICDGPGIPEGDCDCLGNVLDAVGECGGGCTEDADNDGICDDCIGLEDECGVCNGPGAIYECGCSDIPEGDCDCNGNVLDALGECGGDCTSDSNNNGICDDSEVLGCMDLSACNYDPLVNINDGSCEYCSCIGGGDYTLTVEASPASTVNGVTYRFYINMVNTDDKLSAVFGDALYPWNISAPAGVFNSAYNSAWSAEGINPAFLTFFPEIADDTYATIGLDAPAGLSGIPGASDPSLVEDANQLITPFFMQNGQTQLNATTATGASYFVLNTATNGLPNEDMRVLIMQLTTTGSLSGTVNYQIFINGDGTGENNILRTASFNGVGTFDENGSASNPSCGCTDSNACNYNPEAIVDDGSCLDFDVCGICDGPGAIYECGCVDIPEGECDCDGNVLDALGDCGGDCLADADADGICDDEDPCVGQYDSCGVCNGPGAIYECGCADIPQGDCDCNGNVLDALGDCGGDCLADADADGICDDEDPCVGQYDSCGVCNGPGAIYDCGCADIPQGDCDCNGNVLDALGDCGGDCLADADSDGICDDEDPCVGQYDSCGVCNGPGAIYECGCADIPDGDCDCDGNVLDALGECGGDCLADADADGICDDEDPCVGQYDSCGVCNGPGAIYECGCANIPEGDCDCDGNVIDALGDCGGDCLADADADGICDDEDPCVGQYDSCGVCNGPGAIYECGCADIPDGECDCDGNVLDALGECGGDCLADADADGICDDEDPCVGQYDSCGVCNGQGAIYECGCANIPEGECDCDGNVLDALGECGGDCLADADADGICDDEDPCVGQYDSCGVCNGPGAIYDCGCADIPQGDCDCNGNVLDALGECGGDCLADADADGICDDVDPCVGEYDSCGVCNGPGAIYECGCADIPEGDCDCNGNVLDALGECGGDCLVDADADGICDDEDPCVGQYDSCGVCNGPGAIYECGCADIPQGDCDCDGNMLDALGDCGGDCLADADSDGICDDEDPCVGQYDSCGVCNGPGAIYECGCADIPEGDCDCDGNVLDALGDCGGDCLADADADGICDDEDPCVGEYDSCGVCNGPGAVFECGCADIPEGDCDCNGNVIDALGDCGGDCEEDLNNNGICDDEEIAGCTDPLACNYNQFASENDGSCDYSCYGCTVTFACNYDPEATMNNGSCILPGDPCDDGDSWTLNDFLQTDCSCNGYGCTDPDACNFVAGAVSNNALCNYADTYVISGPLTSYLGMEVVYNYPETEGSAYVWSIDEGEIISGDGTSSVSVIWWGNWQGTLCVQEFNMYECTSDIACINVNIVNSIEEHDLGAVNVFPNPARNELFIEFERPNNYHIDLIDILGKSVYSELCYGSTKIDVSSLERGVYFIQASNGSISDTFKVIIH